MSPVKANLALEAAVATTGYYGSNVGEQRDRVLESHRLDDQIEAGQIVIGGADGVLSQIRQIADRLGPGILDLVPAFQSGEPTLRSIRLFGDKVLPRIRDL